MAISSRTLFHFTDSAENLVGILTDDFLPRFCLEEYEQFRTPEGKWLFDMAIPMVSFCDLPLSNVSEHLDFYGDYGIGLSKEWGVRQGINPVLYISPESHLNTHLQRVIEHTRQVGIRQEAECVPNTAIRDLTELLSFVKPVKGMMHRRGKFIQKYFYDEREWRFVPRLFDQLTDENVTSIDDYRLYRDEFLDEVKRAHADDLLGKRSCLAMTPNDIKYLIVPEERQIGALINAVRQIKDRYDAATVDVLASRIVSAVQLRQDF